MIYISMGSKCPDVHMLNGTFRLTWPILCLFQPNFGASLHMLKVEIGGDVQSTGNS